MEIHSLTLLPPHLLSTQPFESLPQGTGKPKNIPVRPLFLTLLLLISLQGSCGGPSVKTTSVAVDSEYTPKKIFDLDFPSAWEKTLQGLKEKNIPVILQDKEKGIIRTDYQTGSDRHHLGRAISSRHKCSIFFFQEGEKKTILNLRCLYEIKETSGKAYVDASSFFPDETVALEKELYRTIESSLLPKQVSRPTSPRTEESHPVLSAHQNPVNLPPVAQASPETSRLKETLPAPSVSTPQAPVDLMTPKPQETPTPLPTPHIEAQLTPPPPAREVTPITPKVEPKARVLGYEPIFLVTKKKAPLREKPSSKSKIIETLKKGRKVEKIGESGNWVKVKIWETTIGWTTKDLLQEIR